jgi:hypothetical protein
VTNSTLLTLAAIQALPGALSFEDCVCTAGGYKDRRDGQHHCGCVAGFYEDWNEGTMTCTMCEANHYCVGSDEYALYEIFTIAINSNGTNPISSTARRLLAYSLKQLYGNQMQCPLHSESGNGSTGCLCIPGYEGGYGNDYTLLCTACPLHTYKELAGNHECTACPLNSTTKLLAATEVRQCNCGEAFYQYGTYQCKLCPDNSVANQGGNILTHSGSGVYYTKSVEAGSFCECDMGYTPPEYIDGFDIIGGLSKTQLHLTYECMQCRSQEYKNYVSNGFCTPCPSGSANPVNHQCQCMPGWTVSAYFNEQSKTYWCDQCEAGKYKHTWGDAVCEQCPEFSWSGVGSSRIEDCACVAGTLGPAGGPCSVIGDCGSPGCLYTDSLNMQKRGIDQSTCTCAAGYIQQSLVTS